MVYLLFNEGYQSTGGGPVVRFDLCGEALRLGTELAGSPLGQKPKTHGLMALLCFQAARLSSRTCDGWLLSLEEQDRSSWDTDLIRRGFGYLDASPAGTEMTSFHLEAAIAACHSSAPTFAQTDWPSIARLYDLLVARDDSPVVRLNRAVSQGYRDGPEAALVELNQLREEGALEGYHLLDACLGEFHLRAGHRDQASAAFDRALGLCRSSEERAYLVKKRRLCL